MATQQCPIVECKGGKVKGAVTRPNHPSAKDVYTYMGIPFAEPPLGKLRFLPPQPLKKKWNGILDGTKAGNAPIGFDAYESMTDKFIMTRKDIKVVRDEDCLNLNVYTPSTSEKENLPVMVYIYGGGFVMGRNSLYSGLSLCGMNDVVLVVPNYRHHVYGFMSFGPGSSVPGNAGLWDQIMALRWVKENIKSFGGNPDNVTIFGQSAGGMSVSSHVLSPESSGLFHKVINHSGTIYSLKPADPSVRKEHVEKLLKKLNITATDPNNALELLQNYSAEELTKAFVELAMAFEVAFSPSFDNKIFTKEEDEIFKEGGFNKVPHITGYNSTEGYGVLSMLVPNFLGGIKEEELANLCKQLLKTSRPKDNIENLLEKATKFYLKPYKSDDTMRFSKAYAEMVADLSFVVGSLKLANYISDHVSDVFLYCNDFQLKCLHDEKFSGGLSLKPDNCRCDHGDDLFMTFGFPFFNENVNCPATFTEEEKELSRNTMTYLTNFAKTGNPNEGKPVSLNWPRYARSHPQGIAFDASCIKTFQNDKKDLMEFWSKTY